MEQPAMDSEVVEQPTSEESSNEHIELDIPSEEGEQQAEEEDEIEVDGKKFVLPKSAAEKLKAERLMQADYTRKTQEVAEQRKQIEQQAQQVQQQAQMHQQYISEIAELTAIDKQLEQFAKATQADWDKLSDEDPVQAMKLDRQMRDLQNQRGMLVSNLTQKQQQQHWERQQVIAKSIQEGQAVLAREIQGWSPELATKLVEYSVSSGMSREQVQGITDPSAVKLIHKAYMYDQLVKKQSATKPNESTPPVTRIAAKTSGAAKDPDKMSADEWLKWRNSQVQRTR